MAWYRNAFLGRLLAASLLAVPGARAALWVAAGGDDRNPGSEELPLRTLGRARDLVRTLNRDQADDLTVFIAGRYFLERPLEFGPEDSGTNGFSIIYTAAPGARPVLSGGVPVAGWTLFDRARNLWSAPAPAALAGFGDLFVNGRPARRTRGRLPQASGGAAAAPAPRWRNPEEVRLESAEPGALWSERVGTPPFFATNAFELLGVPGEWYFDRPARRIYYTPRSGEDLGSADIEAAASQALIVGRGSQNHPLSGLVFKGIRFEYISGPAAGEVAGAAVSFGLSSGIQFLEDDFVHLGAPAVSLGPRFSEGTIEGCLFGDIATAALVVSDAAQVRVADSRFSYVATAHHEDGAIRLNHSEEVAIEHTQIDHFPFRAVLSGEGRPGGFTLATDAVAPPMIADPAGPSPSPGPEAGVTAPFHAILAESLAPPAVPEPPTAVSAEPEDRFAYVTWDPPCLDGGSAVRSYAIIASTGGTMTVRAEEFRKKGYVIFGGLENGRSVSFSVMAASAQGASSLSLSSAAVIPIRKRKLRAPPAPAVAFLGPGNGGPRVRITPPAGTGGSPVVGYSVVSLPAGRQVRLEGWDILHADATHPIERTLVGFPTEAGTVLSIAAFNAAGPGPVASLTLTR